MYWALQSIGIATDEGQHGRSECDAVVGYSRSIRIRAENPYVRPLHSTENFIRQLIDLLDIF